MKSLECLTRRFLAGAFWLMGLLPLPPTSQLYWLILSLGIRCFWIVYISYLLSVGFSFKSVAIESVGNVVGTALFMGNSVLGLMLLLESVLKQRTHTQLEDLRFQSDLQLQRLGMFGRRRQAGYLLALIGTQLICDLVRVAINDSGVVSPVFFISLPLSWLLRFRYVQLVQHVMDLNQRSLQLRRSLLSLASGNDLWQPYGVLECRQLQTLRTTYERIFECYEALSDCYGWGMLGLHLLTSFEFVTNAYWMLTGLYKSQDQNLLSLIFNGATAIDFGTPIVTLFWHGDAGAENGRQIGCLISKLVKPQGSKRYNELVSEFSLQTLHQRFVVTAKDFFSLNLHLLSSMFAAVVTYLVILIQFMFAERSAGGHSG
nr:gustatory receptor 23a isoform X2 [Drosophila kikkawai]